jgi:hypothetical protein
MWPLAATPRTGRSRDRNEDSGGRPSRSPSGWLKLSLNPLKSSGQFSRYGPNWFAAQIHLEKSPKKKDEISAELDRLEKRCDEIWEPSKLLEGLDIDNADHAERIVEVLKSQQDTLEWWAFLSGTFLSFVCDAIEKHEIQQVIWAMGCAERCRSAGVFKENLEEVVWIGQSAKRVIEILRIWDNNQQSRDEGFWPITFAENVYAMVQIFAVPLVFIEDAAYVGGMNINKQNAKLGDYLFS